MRKFFQILFDEQPGLGVAWTVEERDVFSLPDAGRVSNWQPIDLELRGGDYPDYQPSILGCRMCSSELRAILDEHAAPSDELQWLPVRVSNGNETRPYFILHFPNPPDVLDKTKTIFADRFVVKPVLSLDLVSDHRVFAYPECDCLPLFISEDVKRAIEGANLTGGMEIAKLPVA
jgi:hypothetical protein